MTNYSYSFFVPDDPKPKGRPRMAKGTSHVYTPTRTLQSEWRIREHVSVQCPEPLIGAVKLSLLVALSPPVMPKKWQGIRKPTKRPDLDNFIKTVLDALNGIVFKDDSQVVRIDASKEYCWPSNNFKSGWYIYCAVLDG